MEIDADEIKKEKGHDMLLEKIHAERQHIRDLLVVLKQRRGIASESKQKKPAIIAGNKGIKKAPRISRGLFLLFIFFC